MAYPWAHCYSGQLFRGQHVKVLTCNPDTGEDIELQEFNRSAHNPVARIIGKWEYYDKEESPEEMKKALDYLTYKDDEVV